MILIESKSLGEKMLRAVREMICVVNDLDIVTNGSYSLFAPKPIIDCILEYLGVNPYDPKEVYLYSGVKLQVGYENALVLCDPLTAHYRRSPLLKLVDIGTNNQRIMVFKKGV